MARKTPVAPKQPTASSSSQQLTEAIITVKRLQTYIAEHSNVDNALGAVAKVEQLVTLTGGFPQLKEALEIVGKEPA